ncbi:phosphogluconate dehydratase [Haliangium ochraceum]|uniref:Phosphogluconate dehydratase n=1 Tax=Haliangium ochraceum (strain DSM 14365 / JCM 11303 / SMP-2) TaxID=502025 RepID=D0LNL9_HALO1|nr:phosphogluconate dehydratase [Haliangium ochraceum]ACY16924.1 6-phosphogluconate dehydratase [Haliangium ochraceum DSM 14365]
MTQLHSTLAEVTDRIRERSRDSRAAYVDRMQAAASKGPNRMGMSCTNLAHAVAAAPAGDKKLLKQTPRPNIAIVSSYNEMLSAHQPLGAYPPIIKEAAREAGAVAQFAGGVPAMCDGVTQGQPGMEMSLFSRDNIAMATAVALSHDVFDAALCLGICDKIVPGLLIGALSFGHLPVIFVPGGPMRSGLPNKEKARIRQLYAEGKINRDELLEAESKSYHSPGTCTFYGTANSNQMLMEIMGLHLPGSAFINPGTPLRDALTAAAAVRVSEITALGSSYAPLYKVVDERAIINAIVGLLATGGSTNHTIHIIAIARAAGVQVNWTDFSDLSQVVPLLTRVYPNGSQDVNHFQAAGGVGLVIRELLGQGLLHGDVDTVAGPGLERYTQEPVLEDEALRWVPGPETSRDPGVVASFAEPFAKTGGLRLLQGNLGRAVIKTSAVASEHHVVEAPARIFHTQKQLMAAFEAGQLTGDFVAVVRYQGPQANGMPELHKLTPILGVLQDRGQHVALVTDGRMSGASGKVPAAIHVTPECAAGGPLARVQEGDIVRVDAVAGVLEVQVAAEELAARAPAAADLSEYAFGLGRELFGVFRAHVTGAEEGASACLPRTQVPAELAGRSTGSQPPPPVHPASESDLASEIQPDTSIASESN